MPPYLYKEVWANPLYPSKPVEDARELVDGDIAPTEKKFKAKAQELTEYLETQGYEIAGAPVYARYAAKPTFEALN